MKLDKKLNAYFIITIITLSSLMAASFVFMELRHIKESLNERAELIINELASNIEFSLFVRNYDEVEKRVNDVLKNEDVVFCVLKDNYGQIIYENGDKGARNVRHFKKEILREKAREQSEETIFGISAETKEPLGTVQINVSDSSGRKAIALILLLGMAVTLIVIITALLFSRYFLNKLVAAPVQKLMEGTKKIAGGDFSYKVQAHTDDEIGILGEAFNKMTGQLSTTLVSKDFIESIFTSMAEALIVADKDGRITMANKAAEEMTGLSEDELKGTSVYGYFMLLDMQKSAEIEGNIETVCFSKRGKIPVLFGAAFLKSKDNNINGYACAATDISRIKETENSLKNALFKIEKYTGELEESNMKLKELDRLKSSFLSMVSHELRTPLTSIKGYLAFLLRGATGPITETQKDYLESISRNSERLLKLINDLVDLTKMEKGTFAVNKTKSDIVKVMNKCIKEMEPMLASMKLKIITNYESASIELQADEYRLSQVFINVINNAVKFSPADSAITVTVVSGDAEKFNVPQDNLNAGLYGKKCCKVSIKDQGIGMEKQYVNRVFDRFYQIEDINTRKYQGLGLGLNIARNIVEAHGGSIWADSEGKGKGTVFEILIPVE
ncbi:MAG: PAS domain S-box protein [Candidatus Goldbacteria bacterium]|nr:PAS domain S-box protein [Candidatus Goldiibacteriota bacterium]